MTVDKMTANIMTVDKMAVEKMSNQNGILPSLCLK
jgi:hypothetical protein